MSETGKASGVCDCADRRLLSLERLEVARRPVLHSSAKYRLQVQTGPQCILQEAYYSESALEAQVLRYCILYSVSIPTLATKKIWGSINMHSVSTEPQATQPIKPGSKMRKFTDKLSLCHHLLFFYTKR